VIQESFRLWTLLGAILIGIATSALPQEPINLKYQGESDLNGDGSSELVIATAIGADWRSLDIRLEIRNSEGTALFADEWSSRDWLGGPGYWSWTGSVEDWVKPRIERLVDPEYFKPGGSRAPRFGYGGKEGLRWNVRMALYEQIWRTKTGPPLHEHLIQQPGLREILATMEGLVTEEQVEAVLNEVSSGPCLVYQPHWDALDGVAWIPSMQRFEIILFIG
jgi:hypothetical protein